MKRWFSPMYSGMDSPTRLTSERSWNALVESSGVSEWRLRANAKPNSLRGPPPFGSKWQLWHISPVRAAYRGTDSTRRSVDSRLRDASASRTGIARQGVRDMQPPTDEIVRGLGARAGRRA